ncbi:fumarylacetoacetate hydrolase family protein [Lachnospiraceae bacterium 62-35]
MARFVRFQYQENIHYGLLENNTIKTIQGNIFSEYSVTETSYSLDCVKLLSPCEPSKILAIGFNYMDHAIEFKREIPKEPNIFIKPSSSLTSQGEPVIYPKFHTHQVEYESELVIVIGKQAKNVEEENALDYVFGFTIGNDVTARDMQSPVNQWGLCKGFDTFSPLGPWIETEVDGCNLDISSFVNGHLKQKSNTKNLIFNIPFLVSYISKGITLYPGDVIFTGTPAGVGPVHPGDTMEMRIEGIGSLINPVISE